MITDKYKIVVFHDANGCCRHFSCRGWFLCAVVCILAGLVASNAYFFHAWSTARHYQHELATAQKENLEQKVQIVSFSNKIMHMAEDINRLQEFNTKIRVMVNLDHSQTDRLSTHLGGPRTENLEDTFLPLYRSERLARKMHNFLDQLGTDARLEEVRQQEIIQSIRDRSNILARTPSIWPTEGWVTSTFGYRKSPFTGHRELHKGLDISAPTGTPVYATATGTIIREGLSQGYGKNIMIDHGNGVVTRYAHLSRYAVKKGQVIKRGELIAYVGNTGRSTGPHLHYEVRLNGIPVNPYRYILN